GIEAPSLKPTVLLGSPCQVCVAIFGDDPSAVGAPAVIDVVAKIRAVHGSHPKRVAVGRGENPAVSDLAYSEVPGRPARNGQRCVPAVLIDGLSLRRGDRQEQRRQQSERKQPHESHWRTSSMLR